jgi:outer membrane protein insertion porin family
MCRSAVSVRTTLAIVFAFSSLVFMAKPATAQSLGDPTIIEEIEVVGNQRIETATILSYIDLKIGDTYNIVEIDEALKALFYKQLFADVRIVRQGTKVVIEVDENPIINRVVLEGNKALDDDEIFEEIKLRPRLIYTRSYVEADMQAIFELYRRKGRFAAEIEPKIVRLAQNRVDLVFEIKEGPTTGIRRINFLGNKVFSDRQLRGVIVTDETRWWNFFSSMDNFDPDKMTYDKELLRRFYEAHGYADFKVTSAIAEMTPDRKEFFVTFTIIEGEQYTFGKGKIDTTLEDLNLETLESIINFEEGDIYNVDKIDDTVEALTLVAGQFGYAFVDIRPRPRKDRVNKTIAVTFRLKEGPRVYIERIDIVGNNRTLDRVIRRKMRISEGDAYNRIRINRSKNHIEALRYFEDVEIVEEPGSFADKTNIKVKVKEQPTGEFSFGVGFSSSDNVAGDLSISERNLLGRGQTLRFQISGSNRRQQADISFVEPYLFGRNLSAGFNLFRSETDFREEAGYYLSSTGGAVHTSFMVKDTSRLNLLYTYKTDELEAPNCFFGSGSVSNAICTELGARSTSLISYTYTIDERNNLVKPTDGYKFQIKQDFAGIGGDSKYIKTEIEMSAYKKLFFDEIIGSATWKWGFIEGLGGDRVRLTDRFRKGGNSFRGFDISGIGPREVSRPVLNNGNLSRGDSLGGQAFGIATLEVGFPTPLPESYGIEAAVFLEAGTLGYINKDAQQHALDLAQAGVDDANVNIDTFNTATLPALNAARALEDPPLSPIAPLSYRPDAAQDIRAELGLRASVGLSIYWDSPFGPIRLDFAHVLAKEEYDRTKSFRFSAGRRF